MFGIKGMCFITVEDATGNAKLVIWPMVFEAFRKVTNTARLIEVNGQIKCGERMIHLVATHQADRSAVLWLCDEGLAPPMSRADGISHPMPARARLFPAMSASARLREIFTDSPGLRLHLSSQMPGGAVDSCPRDANTRTDIQKRRYCMRRSKPKAREIRCGMEINMYGPAEDDRDARDVI